MYPYFIFFFFFNDTATTEIYTLSLHDALPISIHLGEFARGPDNANMVAASPLIRLDDQRPQIRSEEHTSELQSRSDLVCRLLLEKKKKQTQMQCHLAAHAHTSNRRTWHTCRAK